MMSKSDNNSNDDRKIDVRVVDDAKHGASEITPALPAQRLHH
jgi:hypothetical protein